MSWNHFYLLVFSYVRRPLISQKMDKISKFFQNLHKSSAEQRKLEQHRNFTDPKKRLLSSALLSCRLLPLLIFCSAFVLPAVHLPLLSQLNLRPCHKPTDFFCG